jgi:hypothetical protein
VIAVIKMKKNRILYNHTRLYISKLFIIKSLLCHGENNEESSEREMGGEETLVHRGSLAAPLIFMIVISFQLLSRWLEYLKKVHSDKFPASFGSYALIHWRFKYCCVIYVILISVNWNAVARRGGIALLLRNRYCSWSIVILDSF